MTKTSHLYLYQRKGIIPPILFIFLLSHFVDPIFLFFIYLLLLLWYAIKVNNLKGFSITALIPYCFAIILMFAIGFLKYNAALVLRDTYYALGSVATIFLGSFLFLYSKGGNKSVINTLFFGSFLFSVFDFIKFILLIPQNLSMGSVRSCFSVNLLAVEFLLPVFLFYKISLGKTVFGKKSDFIIAINLLLQLFLSFSRTAIFGSLIVLLVLLLFKPRKIHLNMLYFSYLFIILFVIIIAVFLVVPQETWASFLEKINDSFTEIDVSGSSNSYNGFWRSYEMKMARQYFLSFSLPEVLFGKGFGTLIPISFVPEEFLSFVTIQNGSYGIPLLHNSFFTILIKGGITSFLFYLFVFLFPIYQGRKLTKQGNYNGCFIIAMCFGMLFNAYLVRGLYEQGCEFYWTVYMGWLLSYARTALCTQKSIKKLC
jgi:O-antigen ligase